MAPSKDVGTQPIKQQIQSQEQLVVGVAAAAATSSEGSYVLVKALSTNTDTVFVGGSDVTTANGFELSAGEFSPYIAVANANEIYAISGTAAQALCVLVLG